MNVKNDWCTAFPERWRGKDISLCCREHDMGCDEAVGFKTIQVRFYKCLRKKELSKKWSKIITAGGAIGCGVKWGYFKYKSLSKSKEVTKCISE